MNVEVLEIDEELEKSGDAAKVINKSTDTVRRWAKEGRLPVAARTSRGEYLFRPSALRAVVESLKKTA